MVAPLRVCFVPLLLVLLASAGPVGGEAPTVVHNWIVVGDTKLTSPTTHVVFEGASYMTVDGEFVYAFSLLDGVRVVRRTTGEVVQTFPTSQTIGSLATDESYLWFLDVDGVHCVDKASGTDRVALAHTEVKTNGGLALSTQTGFAYFVLQNAGDPDRIVRWTFVCTADAQENSAPQVIVSDSEYTRNVLGVAVHDERDMIFWGTFASHEQGLFAAMTDGTEPRILPWIEPSYMRQQITGVSVHGDYVYWTERTTKGVYRMKIGTSSSEKLQDTVQDPFGIVAEEHAILVLLMGPTQECGGDTAPKLSYCDASWMIPLVNATQAEYDEADAQAREAVKEHARRDTEECQFIAKEVECALYLKPCHDFWQLKPCQSICESYTDVCDYHEEYFCKFTFSSSLNCFSGFPHVSPTPTPEDDGGLSTREKVLLCVFIPTTTVALLVMAVLIVYKRRRVGIATDYLLENVTGQDTRLS